MTAIFKALLSACVGGIAFVHGDQTCGGGMHVSKYGRVMDEQVQGIVGTWEKGCSKCGQTLQLNNMLPAGWYCEKANWGWNPGIWLKRDNFMENSTVVKLPSTTPKASVKHDSEMRTNAKTGDVDCGGGMYVQFVGEVMDEKVWGIVGKWEKGCYGCGQTLWARGILPFGWYCEKADYGSNPGIWLKHDSSMSTTNETPFTAPNASILV